MNARTLVIRTETAVAFLKALDATGRHHLTALDPETGAIESRNFAPRTWSGITAWITARAHLNLYYGVNEPLPDAPHTKLRKEHIARIRAIVADLDPAGATAIETAASRVELLRQAEELAASEHPPTFCVDSGNGVQVVWKLASPLDAKVHRIDAEDLGAGIAAVLYGDAVHNVDRIMRLPGTHNHASPKKRVRGLVGGPVRVLEACSQPGAAYTIEELEQSYDPIAGVDQRDRDAAVQAALDMLDWNAAQAGPTPELIKRLRAAGKADPYFAGLLSGDLPRAPGDGSGSAWRAALAGSMARKGFDLNDYAPFAYGFEPGQPRDGGEVTARMLARDWARVGTVAQAAAPKASDLFVPISDEAEIDTSDFPAIEAGSAPRPDIRWVRPGEWVGRERRPKLFYVDGMIPHNEVTLLTGKGGIGKSLLALQMLVSVALGLPFMGAPTVRAKVAGFFCEDDDDVLHARLVDICEHLGVGLSDLDGWLWLSSRKYEDNLLCAWDRNSSTLKRTPLFEALERSVKAFGAKLVSLDTIADVFGGDEINRQQVRQFIQSCAGRLAAELDGACLLLGHPSRAGEQSGEGTSGSTAWHGTVRSRLYMEEIGEVGSVFRKLTTMKSNYGPGGATWILRWHGGALEVVSGSRPATEGVPETKSTLHRVVLSAVASANRDGVRLAMGATSKFKAEPTLRRRDPAALGPFSAKDVEEAIHQLVAIGQLVEATIGQDQKRRDIVGLLVVDQTVDEDILSENAGLFD